MKNTPYRLICSDIDGTLLNADRDIAEATRDIIHKVKDKIPVVLASSRMPSAMYYLQEKLGIKGSPLIAYNGGLILGEHGEVLQSNPLKIDVLKIILNHQEKHSYNISTYCDDNWRTAETDYWTQREINNTRVNPTLLQHSLLIDELEKCKQRPHKIMCMGEAEEIDSLVSILKEKAPDEANLYRSKDTYLEVTAQDIDKSKALQFLLDTHYNLPMQSVIAFGDNHNDELLLKNAGMGVAMANATENVKLVAHYQSPFTNKEDGVAKALHNFLFTEESR